ncbi:MAG: protein kinase [Anaerolineae bacterium]|nr:protein kinase [Anaerolineae bacterium]
MAAERSRSTSPPPRLQNRYTLVEWLGEGSMGAVYRAHDDVLDRDVAIKFLSPERIASQEAGDRFWREARSVARLSHANIMAIHDVGQEDAWRYLVLEYIPGRDLRALLIERGRAFSASEAVETIEGTLQALAYAHNQGIIHRDIKPENVMLTPDGAIKVTDFGLALARGEARLTQEGMVVGTILYLPPEVIAGQPADHRSDLYAVGAVFYELLTGRPPFASGDPMQVFSQILNTPATPPRALDPTIPVDLEHIVLRLLDKDPAKRYTSAQDVLAALPSLAEIAPLGATLVSKADAERSSLSLLERIVRSSSTVHPKQKAVSPPDPDEESLLALSTTPPPDMAADLLVYAAFEDTAAAVEAERRRLAGLLQGTVIDALNLLLSQSNAYEQTLGANPMARMAVSVLTSLARQAMQSARDLEANLHPTLLDTLGLEPALESLSNQIMRAYGLQITLALERMRERPPVQIELALFRAAQDALDRAVRHAHASQVAIRLERREQWLVFSLSDNGIIPPDELAAGKGPLHAARRRIEQLSGAVETGLGPGGGLEWTVRFLLDAPIELTPREMEIVELLVEGLSNKEIARILSISPRTVNFHLDNIYSKLGVNSRTEAAIYALRHGWVKRPAEL